MKCCECKVEEAVILTVEKEVFCLDCYKQIVTNALRRQNEFVYPNEISILEGKDIHNFSIEHSIREDGFLWVAMEKDGFYDVQHLASIEESFEGAYLGFIEKIIDTIYTKVLKQTFISKTWNVFKSELADVQMSTSGQIAIHEDDLGHIFFVIDGKTFSPDQLADLLAPFKGKILEYQISDPSVDVLKEDESLVHAKK